MVAFAASAVLRVASGVGVAVVVVLAAVVAAFVVGVVVLPVRGFVLAVVRGGLVVVLVLTSLVSAGHFRDAVAVCCRWRSCCGWRCSMCSAWCYVCCAAYSSR